MSYHDFINNKRKWIDANGIDCDPGGLNRHLFPYQRAIVHRALIQGRFCIWADCGLGKTLQQLAWADQVHKHTGAPVLVLAPLAVSTQTVREGAKFDIEVTQCQSQDDVTDGINITNYQKLDRFDADSFSGIVLDESSILKSYTGKYRTQIIESFASTPFKLACSATPAPNDYMELGNHAEFVGAMTREEMLAMFFTHDGGRTSDWRIKGHAVNDFWRWVCSWAVMIRKPSDLDFADDGFNLPDLVIHDHAVESNIQPPEGLLFWHSADTLSDQRHIRRESLEDRCDKALEIVQQAPDDQWLIWCDLNDESEMLSKMIPGAVEIKGSDSDDHKTISMIGFQSGTIKSLVTKPSIAGFGMNWQNCHNVIFVGMSHSYEAYYQAVRRCWRFGQNNSVNVHIVYEQREGAVIANIRRKDDAARQMADAMAALMRDESMRLLGKTTRTSTGYQPSVDMFIPDWLKYPQCA